MKQILKLNEISPVVKDVFRDRYELTKESAAPVGIMLRSFAMHEYNLAPSVLCVGRAGAGVNNIPVDRYTTEGVVVFNTPGANANAVKELLITALLLSSRKVLPAIEWAKSLKGKGDEVGKLVEKGKGAFVGPEISGKTIGVIGLGAIGAMVANVCVELGMNVIGYDPYISIDGAWNLDRHISRAADLSELYHKADYITMHVPFTKDNKGMINAESIATMKDSVAIINLARGELVDNAAIKAAIAAGKVSRYVTDFPCEDVLDVEGIVAIPHLGASTPEAEDNCARMAAKQMVDFIENGNITNSVNFAACALARTGECRVTIIHKNIQSMLNKFTDSVASVGINIANMLSQSRGDYAYTILDLDGMADDTLMDKLSQIVNVVKVRKIV